MVLKMKYSISNMCLALGFLTVSIFSSLISTVLGGSSIRAGLTLSIVIFFLLAMPFGIRYFITSKIILINICLFFLVLIFYFISVTIFTESDSLRFSMSLMLLFFMSFASLAFVTTLDYLKDNSFHKILIFSFYLLMCLGYAVLVRKFVFGYESKDMILFREPSHYALVFIPFVLYAAYTCHKKLYAVLYISLAMAIALIIQNLILLVGCLMVIFLVFAKSFWSLFLIMSAIIALAFVLDLQYFLERLDFSADNQNLSTLVFLSGWERAYLSFTASYGFGVGFQQLGFVGPEGELQIILQSLMGESGLNAKDGGTLGSKLVAEMGFLGLILLLFYLYFSIRLAKKFLQRQIIGSKNIFFLGVYLLFSMELFLRGMGYFSLLSFMFLSSFYWINRSRFLVLQSLKV